jgi:dienelactone hydrolase
MLSQLPRPTCAENAPLPQRTKALALGRWLAALTVLLVACAMPAAAQTALDASLREEVHRVPVTVPGWLGPQIAPEIVVTSFRPEGKGPFPWIMLSRGTGSRVVNSRIGRARNLPIVREWVNRGFAVLVPIRRGYGETGGSDDGDSYISTRNPQLERAGEGATVDLLATHAWARQQPDLDANTWLFVGQSAGGFASIYAASKQPAGLVAVLNFAGGRGGQPDVSPGRPIFPDRMADLFKSVGGKVQVPVLWHYASNDEFFGPAAATQWFEAFRAGGGRGTLKLQPPFRDKGHRIFGHEEGIPMWTAAVAEFVREHGLAVEFK